MSRLLRRTLPLLALLALARPARAELPGLRDELRHFGNLTLGLSTAGSGTAICGELSPWHRIGIQACGNGAGFLHQQDQPEIAHFLAKAGLGRWRLHKGELEARAGLGFAELQLGADEPGFDFDGVGAQGHSTSGPETAASLRGLWPMAAGFEVVAEVSGYLAWFRHAGTLVRPQARWQPSATFSLGVGF